MSSGIESTDAAAGDGNNSHQQKKPSGPARMCLKIADKFETYREKGKDPDYRKERRERITIVGLIATATFTFIAAIIFWCQLRTFQKTDVTLHQTMISASRAWIAPKILGIHGDIKSKNAADLWLEYLNPGKEPALDAVLFEKPDTFPMADLLKTGDVRDSSGNIDPIKANQALDKVLSARAEPPR
ncbi:MAG TPA: hypothetical protein VHX43_12575 [Xanthobacteraceae bacterium]|jgi:hypothetical protein|nr:hypothetical protein [Xanthobacteraceae bacterium]